MNAMKEGVLKEPRIDVLPGEALATDACLLKDFDVNTVRIEQLDYKAPFSVTAGPNTTRIHGFVVHFDIDFLKDCTKPVFFSTGAAVTPTHWMQTVFYLPQPFDVTPGTVLAGTFDCKRGSHYHRDLELELTFQPPGQEPVVLRYLLN